MSTVVESTFYDSFYAEGGWRYSLVKEWWWHRQNLVRRFRLRRGTRMLEIACGMGFHTDLFRRMGFECVGLDSCATAIRHAHEHFPRSEYRLADALGELPFPAGHFDTVITRGCSLYHYDLTAETSIACTTNSLRQLREGGLFVLIIATDLSGRRDEGRIWQNRLEDYSAHFARFGRPYSIDWYRGMVICGMKNTPLPNGEGVKQSARDLTRS